MKNLNFIKIYLTLSCAIFFAASAESQIILESMTVTGPTQFNLKARKANATEIIAGQSCQLELFDFFMLFDENSGPPIELPSDLNSDDTTFSGHPDCPAPMVKDIALSMLGQVFLDGKFITNPYTIPMWAPSNLGGYRKRWGLRVNFNILSKELGSNSRACQALADALCSTSGITIKIHEQGQVVRVGKKQFDIRTTIGKDVKFFPVLPNSTCGTPYHYGINWDRQVTQLSVQGTNSWLKIVLVSVILIIIAFLVWVLKNKFPSTEHKPQIGVADEKVESYPDDGKGQISPPVATKESEDERSKPPSLKNHSDSLGGSDSGKPSGRKISLLVFMAVALGISYIAWSKWSNDAASSLRGKAMQTIGVRSIDVSNGSSTTPEGVGRTQFESKIDNAATAPESASVEKEINTVSNVIRDETGSNGSKTDSLLKKIWTEYNADTGITTWAVGDMELLEVPSHCEKVESDGSFSPKGTAVYFGRAKLSTKRASVIAFYMGDNNEPHPGALTELPEKIIKILSGHEKLRSRPEIDGCWIDPVEWIDEANLLITAYAVSQGNVGFQVNNFRCVWNVRTNECAYDEAYKSKDESFVFNDVSDSPLVPNNGGRFVEGEKPNNAMPSQVNENSPEPIPQVEASRYSGQVGNLNAQFELKWLPNNEVEGVYWHPSRNPNLKYRVHGLNIREGEMVLSEYTNGAITANITLLKNDRNGKITWSGIMENTDGRKLNVSFVKNSELRMSGFVEKNKDKVVDAPALDAPSDVAIKQKLLGYWGSPRHEYLYKSNGIAYMVGGTTTSQWDVRDGVYFQDSRPHDIVSLSDKKFVFRSRESGSVAYEMERHYEKDLEQYYADWIKEHR